MVHLLSNEEQARLTDELRDPIEYRKSGLSLNHVIGCPLDCGYCVRHLFQNFEMKQPRSLMTDDEAVDRLTSHQFFRPHATPIQIFNRATDPLLPSVKPHLFRVLTLLDAQGLTNNVLVISRYRLTKEDCDRFNSFAHLRISLLFTWSGIEDSRIEPIDSEIAANSLRLAFENARRYRTILYWRPIVPGLNDSDRQIEQALAIGRHAHAIAFTGLFYRAQIRAYYESNGLPQPYTDVARRKILTQDTEARVIAAQAVAGGTPIFRKTSCAVSYAHRLPDYNGHYGVREICDICPADQISRCARSFRTPSQAEVGTLCRDLGIAVTPVVTERAVEINGLDEQRRYYLQHYFQHQVHNPQHPHRYRRHGRADVGWQSINGDE